MHFGENCLNTKRPIIVAVTGGSGSGKSTFCKNLQKALSECEGGRKINFFHLMEDDYYKDIGESDPASINFDHPESKDQNEFVKDLFSLKNGKEILARKYDFSHHKAVFDGSFVGSGGFDVVAVDGIHVMSNDEKIGLYDVKVFVDVPSGKRLSRRIRRDVLERGRSVNSVLTQWDGCVEEMFKRYTKPAKKKADYVATDDNFQLCVHEVVDVILSGGVKYFYLNKPFINYLCFMFSILLILFFMIIPFFYMGEGRGGEGSVSKSYDALFSILFIPAIVGAITIRPLFNLLAMMIGDKARDFRFSSLLEKDNLFPEVLIGVVERVIFTFLATQTSDYSALFVPMFGWIAMKGQVHFKIFTDNNDIDRVVVGLFGSFLSMAYVFFGYNLYTRGIGFYEIWEYYFFIMPYWYAVVFIVFGILVLSWDLVLKKKEVSRRK